MLSHTGGRIGLLDYGQSKQLPEHVRLSLARLMLELGRGRQHARPAVVVQVLHEMGLRFSRPADELQMMMAFGMFDSQLSHRCRSSLQVTSLAGLSGAHEPSRLQRIQAGIML